MIFCVFQVFEYAAYAFFLFKQHFYKQDQAEIGKNWAKPKQHTENELLLFENYLLSSSALSSKNNRGYSKKLSRKQVCLFIYFNEIIWLILVKVKKKSRSHKCDINRPMSRYGLTYTNKHKKCLSMMMLICIKEHPTNTWGSIYENVREHWG